MTSDFLTEIRKRAESSKLACHVVLVEQNIISLRIANSQIEQPTSAESFFVFVKLGRDGHVASSQAEGPASWAVDKAWQEAENLFVQSPQTEDLLLAPPGSEEENPNLPPLPSPREAIDFARRALVGKSNAAGMLKLEEKQLAVVNSLGLLRTANRQLAHFFLSQNGFVELAAPSLPELAKLPVDLFSSTKEPQRLASGSYRVLLGPSAVSDLVEGIAQCGFGGREYLEGVSFLHESKTVGGEAFTLTDDWKATAGLPFDFQGTSRSCLSLVERGAAKGPVTDLAMAKKLGSKSTGHSLPPWEGCGPLPLNLVMASGEEEDLLASLGEGLYLPRFHYLGLVNPRTATFTGTIRDCLWVRGGKIQGPVLPLRFTESFLDLAGRIETMGKQRRLVPGSWGNNLVPQLVLSCFTLA